MTIGRTVRSKDGIELCNSKREQFFFSFATVLVLRCQAKALCWSGWFDMRCGASSISTRFVEDAQAMQ